METVLQIDENIVSQLISMGFPRNRCEKAAHETNNQGVGQATDWIFEHMDDPDIDEPLSKRKSIQRNPNNSSSMMVDENAVESLMSMGFSREQSIKALHATSNHLERATDWIFSHDESPMLEDSEDRQSLAGSTLDSKYNNVNEFSDGRGVYRLKGFITHIGSSAQCGHYVCHIKKNGKWAFFNDSAVALSEDPPKDMGYLYFFEREPVETKL